MRMMLLAVHWQNTITTGSVLIAAILSLIGFAEAIHIVRRKNRISDLEADLADLQREMENADRAAKRWEVERNAADAAMQRLKIEHLEDKAKFAEEQREIRHNLKAERDACQMELQVANARTDQTIVLEGQKTIVGVIERMEERAARRDSAMLENQKKIAQSLDELERRVTARVGEVVQEKVDQLQPDTPSPDRK